MATYVLVLVAASMGGFTAPIVCTRRRMDLLVLLNAMIPRTRRDLQRVGVEHGFRIREARTWQEQSMTPLDQPWPLASWPDVPTRASRRSTVVTWSR